MKQLELLVNRLCAYDSEQNWFEFKCNNYKPDMIGASISALANGAALAERDYAYMIWGINDETHEIVGTSFDQYTLKIGNQEFESWLRNNLSKNADFDFQKITINDKNIVILTIHKAVHRTVDFKKIEYIKVGSYTKKLNDYPDLRMKLWDRIRMEKFENMPAKPNLSITDALNMIDYTVYFRLKGEKIPSTDDSIMHYMNEEGIIKLQDNGLYCITNLGAVLFANRLKEYDSVSRKAVRIIQYEGNDRMSIAKELEIDKGYAVCFEEILQVIMTLLPGKEEITMGIRTKKFQFPLIAIREAVANALIHQDFSITGTGPLIEIFKSRMEITNAGIPLIDIIRIIDDPPRSRNEKIASLMRRLGICEELGTGWDKIVLSCEMERLPAPKIILYSESTRVVLYSEMPFSNIPAEDRIYACYMHACIKYISGEPISNRTIRERFGLKTSSSATASRMIKDTVDKKLIKPVDPNTAPRYKQYIPFWA